MSKRGRMGRKGMTPIKLFEEKVMYEPNTGCWLWTGGLPHISAYGQFHHDGQRAAHRWSYQHFKGPIPDGLVIDHLCDTPRCVNPDHLKACTDKENVLRSISGRSAVNARKTHCIRGHELKGDNIYVRPDGMSERACRACNRMRDIKKNAARSLRRAQARENVEHHRAVCTEEKQQ